MPDDRSTHRLCRGRKETRTTYSMQHNGETCECHLPSTPPPTRPPCTLRQSYTPRPSLSLFIAVKYGYLSLYYIVLTCPILLLTYIRTTYVHLHALTRAHTHTNLLWACVVFWLACCWTCTPSRARQSPPFQPAKSLGCCSFTSPALHLRCTARHWLHCTALAPQAGIGLDGGGLGLGCRASERASKAVELLRRAPGLPVCPSLTSGIGLLSTFKFLLTGPPRQFQPASPTHPSSLD
jgi:hypothetical protein